jgi:hypothetical protein
MAQDKHDDAAAGEVVPSRTLEIEAALEQVGRLTRSRTGLDLPPWTGHDPASLPTSTSTARMPGQTMLSRPVAAVPEKPRAVAEKPAPAPRPVREPTEAPTRRADAASRLLLTAAERVGGPEAAEETPASPPVPGDNEGLRTLIRSVVREELRAELRGDLGLGLTRTVRKVVRQEVNQAMAAKEVG